VKNTPEKHPQKHAPTKGLLHGFCIRVSDNTQLLPTRVNIDHIITPRFQIQEKIFVKYLRKLEVSKKKNPTGKNIMPTLID